MFSAFRKKVRSWFIIHFLGFFQLSSLSLELLDLLWFLAEVIFHRLRYLLHYLFCVLFSSPLLGFSARTVSAYLPWWFGIRPGTFGLFLGSPLLLEGFIFKSFLDSSVKNWSCFANVVVGSLFIIIKLYLYLPMVNSNITLQTVVLWRWAASQITFKRSLLFNGFSGDN